MCITAIIFIAGHCECCPWPRTPSRRATQRAIEWMQANWVHLKQRWKWDKLLLGSLTTKGGGVQVFHEFIFYFFYFSKKLNREHCILGRLWNWSLLMWSFLCSGALITDSKPAFSFCFYTLLSFSMANHFIYFTYWHFGQWLSEAD